MSKLLSKRLLDNSASKWLKLYELQYRDESGSCRSWESIERTAKSASVNFVAVFAKLISKTEPLKTLIITQYRPPDDAHVVEFPAGLVDEGESPIEAAIRELKEETGYIGTYASHTIECVSDPGTSCSDMIMVTLDVQLFLFVSD